MSRDEPYDPGLQPERTALAWRRTSLALVAAALGALKVTWGLSPLWASIASGVALVAAAWILALANRRYRRTHRALTAGQEALPGDGVLPGATAALSAAAGLLALLLLLTQGLPPLLPP